MDTNNEDAVTDAEQCESVGDVFELLITCAETMGCRVELVESAFFDELEN